MLSVSSVGSEAMQLGLVFLMIVLFVFAFSILGRIGGDATRLPGSARPTNNRLSVSSVGSEAMQHQVVDCGASGIFAFSILGRIGGDATYWSGAGEDLVLPFSILGRIGGDATVVIVAVIGATLLFQYPRSDRRRCNW